MKWKPRAIQAAKPQTFTSRALSFELLESRELLAGAAELVSGFGPTVEAGPPATGHSSALSTYVPPLITITSTNQVQTVRVIVLNFEPTVPSMGNRTLWSVLGYNDPRNLAAGFVADVEAASGEAIDYEIVEWRDLNEFPVFTDGFRYTADEYVHLRQTNPPNWWNTNPADFYVIAEQQELADLVNNNVIDEIWMFGDHFFNLLGEAWMAGPQSFFVNGPSFPDFPVDRAVAGFGFNYERGVAEMLHNFGHRTENHMVRAYGGWNANPVTPWDFFTADVTHTSRPTFGVGSVHFPANGTTDYDYANTQTVNSYADDFVMNFPNQNYNNAVPITRDAWGDLGTGWDWQRGYLRWFFGHLPRGSGTDPHDGRQNNWYKYINDFNSYRPNTGLARDNEAILGAAPLTEAGSTEYEFTLRYYDVQGINTSTLGDSDVLVTSPGGFNQLATLVAVEPPQMTTAGTAHTVRYRITAPGGTWDAADSAYYFVDLRASEVRDTSGAFLSPTNLGLFLVDIPGAPIVDVAAMRASGQAMVTATISDIGGPAEIFDKNPGSLYRTPRIDPAVVTIEFTTPQTLTGTRLMFSGGANYRWQMEVADSLGDLDSKSGTYQLLVPLTDSPSLVFSSASFGAVSKSHVRLTVERLTGDEFVHINSWDLLGPTVADTAAPAAMLQVAPLVMGGDEATTFSVRYSDDRAVDFRSINFGDIRVTGPNGFSQTSGFYALDVNAAGATRDATYFVSAPGGVWDGADNGTYVVELVPQQVFDQTDKPVAPLVLGSFLVNLPQPEARPKPDMTELNAADWFAAAQFATATTSDDTSHKTTGAASVRFDTTGGFDTFLRYEPASGALWDLTEADEFYLDVYAQNPSPSGFQEPPIIRFIDADGDWMEFRYFRTGDTYPLWSDARGQWISETIPIKSTAQPATGWRGAANGTPDWTRMRTVEIHADTWDHGFTLWFDRVGFNLPVVEGDFDGDLTVDAADIDRLVQATNEPYNPLFDLNDDGDVTYSWSAAGSILSDSDVLIRTILHTEYGDLDLDGQVYLSDLAKFATNYRQAGQFGWADGNINGSQEPGTAMSPRVFLADLSVLATYWRFGVGIGSGAALLEPSAGGDAVATAEPTAEPMSEPLVARLNESTAAPSETTVSRAASIALSETETDWQGAPSRGFIKRFRRAELGGDDLLLLALDRVGSSARPVVTRPARDVDGLRRDDGDSGSLIDELFAVAEERAEISGPRLR
jgi:hypothetical protein